MSNEQPCRETDSHTSDRELNLAIIQWMLVGLFLYGSVYMLGEAKNFLVPIVFAFLLSMVFAPVRRFLGRRGVHPALSSFVIVTVLLCAMFAFATALAMPVTKWLDNASQIQNQIETKLTTVSGPLDSLYQANERLDLLSSEPSPDVEKVEVEKPDPVTKTVMTAPTVLAQIVFTLVLLLFLLASGDMFYEKLVHVMPTLRDKKRAVRIVRNIERKLSRYLFTITVINACLGVAVGLAMWLFGMPSPMVFGVLAFLFNFVPYLGALVGIAVASAVALVSFNWIGWPLLIGGVYFALNSIEGQFVTPYFVGRNLRLNTVVVFISITFWAWLWSAIGMIVAVPLLGPVDVSYGSAPAAIFSQDKTQGVRCSRATQASCNAGLRKNSRRPCGLQRGVV